MAAPTIDPATQEWTVHNAIAKPAPIKAFNAVLDVGDSWAARKIFSLDPADVCAAARKQSGLDDLGPDTFWDGLVVLSAALDDAGPSPMGRMMMRKVLVDALASRARVFDWAGKHPEAMAKPIFQPLMICGLPRTGTTYLSFLFGADPDNRTLRYFEAPDPAPPPIQGREDEDPRMIASFKQLDGLAKLAPGFQAMHPMEPAAATEVVSLHMHEMTSMQIETQAHIPAYAEWMDQQDLRSVYRYEELALKVLQDGYDSTRWNLKTPAYLAGLDAIFDVYPNARMVWTHRDPADVVVSVSSLNAALHQVMMKDVDPVVVGHHWLERLGGMVDRALAYLDEHPDAPITHLHYSELTSDPVGAVERVYGDLGFELDDEAKAAVTAATQHHRQDKHGRHRYKGEDFDLDRDMIRDRFSAYCERFAT